jgi:hypothetical protein
MLCTADQWRVDRKGRAPQTIDARHIIAVAQELPNDFIFGRHFQLLRVGDATNA